MTKVIMAGCDLHDRFGLVCCSVGSGAPQTFPFFNDASGRIALIARLLRLAEKHKTRRIVFAYEASGLGYGLSDLLDSHGIECYVLSPTRLPKSAKSAKQKTDAKDARMLLEQVRGFVLAGNELPVVWTPPQRLRDDRELVRARVDTSDETTRVKLQALALLKRYQIAKPRWYSTRWTRRFVKWLREEAVAGLDPTVAPVLECLISRYELCHGAQLKLDKAIRELAQSERYRVAHQELRKLPGVGLLTAMTFLTEMGDLTRFHNRREVAAYLGLCPSSFQTGGPGKERKGRITRQGPSRLRKMLCQAAWVSMMHCKQSRQVYTQVRQGQSKRSKKALVALMRRLGVKMWHRAIACGVALELVGRGGPHALVEASARAQQRDGVAAFASPSLSP